MINPAYEATNSDVEKLIARTKQLSSLMAERFSMNPISAKILREDWEKEFPDHESLAKRFNALIAALELAQKDGKEKSSSKEGFIEADRFKIPSMPEKVSAYDMRETLNVPMFEDEAQASANGFNQCLLECKPIHEAAKRMSRGIDELLKEMDAMQENINHKQKTISILRDRSESAEKRIAELEAATPMREPSALCVKPLCVKPLCVKLPEAFYPDGDIEAPLVVNLDDAIEAIAAAGGTVEGK